MTPADFIVVYPEFAAVDPVRIQFFIDRADPHFDVDRWGDFYDEGLGCYVAHSLAVSAAQTAQTQANDPDADAIRRKAADSEIAFSEQVKVLQLKGSPFLRTNYGQQYLDLRRMIGIGGVSV
jgi:hypothetical protein